MWNFENNCVNGVVEAKYSRFIASWVNACHSLRYPVYFDDEFESWLRYTMKVPEDDIRNIMEMASCGKLEYQTLAKLSIENSEGYAMYRLCSQ